ncbi:DUF2911 domain-containing protein [Pontibacter sp. SGAir0037]|uniref:DUF2911 domain-containing protein n=1 Tax=Pontibacter sp. SGAir0037 TaxID=2571030 RepID=UPI0010CCCBBB|nr:DUF2911 domain-containing protein [Pontibacter sp. SGAir0037]QCR23725.1 hypothetical protein C1N53_16150 [Pontibacter sp. SGAir0037]
MKKNSVLSFAAVLLVSMLLTTVSWAQNANASKPSPSASASGKVGEANITINYSSPGVKGRTVWGELVPYGKVWRAGANEATTFTVDKDVMVEGENLPAGTYSLYAIPGEAQWTIIFNKVAKQWGTQYDEKQDQLRVTTKPRKAASMSERLAYDVTNNGFVLRWENLEVPVSVKSGNKI